eukprot:gene4522-4960_t
MASSSNSMECFQKLKACLDTSSSSSSSSTTTTSSATSSSTTKVDSSISNKIILERLMDLEDALTSSSSCSLFLQENPTALPFFEEVALGKKVHLTRSFLVLLRRILLLLSTTSPGYLTRSLFQSMASIFQHKLVTLPGKELSLGVLHDLLLYRSADLGVGLQTDCLVIVNKAVRMAEQPLRLAAMKILACLVNPPAGTSGSSSAPPPPPALPLETLQEVLKIASKIIYDRSAEMRGQAAFLLDGLARRGHSLDSVLPLLVRGLEDEDAVVQRTAARAMATLYQVLCHAYQEKMELSKIGAARGDDSKLPSGGGAGGGSAPPAATTMSTASRLAALTKLTSAKKTLMEEVNDFKTIVDNLLKLVVGKGAQGGGGGGAASNLRAGYLLVWGFFIQQVIPEITLEELESIPSAFLLLAQEGVAGGGGWEEQVVGQARLSALLRAVIFCAGHLSENQLLALTSEFCRLCSAVEVGGGSGGAAGGGGRGEGEVLISLQAIDHLLSLLGATAVAVEEEVLGLSQRFLRHPSFMVRQAAVQAVVRLAKEVEGLGNVLASQAVLLLRKLLREILEGNSGVEEEIMEGAVPPAATTIGSSSTSGKVAGSSATGMNMTMSSRRMSFSVNREEEGEMLQRLYFIHGHVYLATSLLKHLIAPPTSTTSTTSTTSELSSRVIEDCCAVALEMMDCLATTSPACAVSEKGRRGSQSQPSSSRKQLPLNVLCSIHRAGAWLLASALPHTSSSSTTELALTNLSSLFSSIATANNVLLTASSGLSSKELFPPPAPAAATPAADDALYEMMFVEAGLLVIRALLTSSSSLGTEVPGGEGRGEEVFLLQHLETAFHLFKHRYQPLYRGQTRLQSCHCLLLGCVTLLPPALIPPPLFVEALRVLRDGLASGLQCSWSGRGKVMQQEEEEEEWVGQWVCPAELFLLKVEGLVYPLPRKEYEVYQTLFEDEKMVSLYRLPSSSTTTTTITTSCCSSSAMMDRRTLDVAIHLLARSFPFQSNDYQDKAVQLLAQATSQLYSSSSTSSRLSTKSLSLFTSDEERRKKEKRQQIVLVNTLVTLKAIVQHYPVHEGEFFDLAYAWRQSLVDLLYSLLAQTLPASALIPAASSVASAAILSSSSLSTSSGATFALHLEVAQTLACFAMKWKGSTVATTVAGRIRSLLLSRYGKKRPTMTMTMTGGSGSSQTADNAGYLLALGGLWKASKDSDQRALLQLTLLDSLQKADGQSSAVFLVSIVTALATICQAQLPSSTTTYPPAPPPIFAGDQEGVSDLFEGIIQGVTIALASLNVTEDSLLLLQHLLHLLARALALAFYADLSWAKINTAQRLMHQVVLHCTSLGAQTPSPAAPLSPAVEVLWNEYYRGLLLCARYDQKGQWSTFLCSEVKKVFDSFVMVGGGGVGAAGGGGLVALDAALDIFLLLLHSFPQIILQHDFSEVILQLPRHCLASSSSCPTTSLGLDLKYDHFHLQPAERWVARVLYKSWQALASLVEQEVVADLPQRLPYWLLHARSIILDLQRGVATAAPAVTTTSSNDEISQDRDDEEEEEVAAGEGGGAKKAAAVEPTYRVDSVRAFLVHYREVSMTSQVLAWPLAFKAEMVALVRKLLARYAYPHSATYPAKLELFLARYHLQQHLVQLSSRSTSTTHATLVAAGGGVISVNLTEKQLLAVPCPISLYLTDMVNLACACATMTTRDEVVRPLQTEATLLLHLLVSHYLETLDPDHTDNIAISHEVMLHGSNVDLRSIMKTSRAVAAGGAEGKILVQYLSQILGVLRTTLALRYHPVLLSASSEMLLGLVEGELLTDSLLVRRVLRPFQTFASSTLLLSNNKVDQLPLPSNDTSSGGGGAGSRRRRDYGEIVVEREKVVYLTQLARLLYPITTANSNVRGEIGSLFKESLSVLKDHWTHLLLSILHILHPTLPNTNTSDSNTSDSSSEEKSVLVQETALPLLHALISSYPATPTQATSEVVQLVYLLATQALTDLSSSSSSSYHHPVQSLKVLVKVLLEISLRGADNIPFTTWLQLLDSLLATTILKLKQQQEEQEEVAVGLATLWARLRQVFPVETATSPSFFSSLSRLSHLLVPAVFSEEVVAEIEGGRVVRLVDVAGLHVLVEKKKALCSVTLACACVRLWLPYLSPPAPTTATSSTASTPIEMLDYTLRLSWLAFTVATLQTSSEEVQQVEVVTRTGQTLSQLPLLPTTYPDNLLLPLFQRIRSFMWQLLPKVVRQKSDGVAILVENLLLHHLLTSPPAAAASPATLPSTNQQVQVWTAFSASRGRGKGCLAALLEGASRALQSSHISSSAERWLSFYRLVLPLLLSSLLDPFSSSPQVVQQQEEEQERVAVVQLWLLLIATWPLPEQQALFDQLLLVSLPLFCQEKQQQEEQEVVRRRVVRGKVLTAMARRAAESFRTALTCLSDSEKALLQAAMKAALLAEQQPHPASTTISSGSTAAATSSSISGRSGGGLKLNVDKYRK